MMTLFLLTVLFLISVESFSISSGFLGKSVGIQVNNANQLSMEYIPSGMSKEQWKKLKEKEKGAVKGKDLGKVGITTFKSRTFMEWQKSGGKNLFPVDPRTVKSAKDLPYMQRPGGQPDDSDLKKPNPLASMFQKKAAKKDIEPVKKPTNWWTL